MNKVINIIVCTIEILFLGLVIITGILPNFILDTKVMLGCLFIPIILSCIAMGVEIKKSKNRSEKDKIKKFWIKNLFCMYCFGLFAILFLENEYRLIDTPYNGNPFTKEHLENVNIIPFKTIISFLVSGNIKVFILNIGINLLIFMPMGVFIPILFKNNINNLKRFIFVMIIISLTVEILQFITFRGAADVDDVILNVSGSMISYLFIKSKMKKIFNIT